MSRGPSFLGAVLLLAVIPSTPLSAAAGVRPPKRRVELLAARPPEGMQPFEGALRDVLVARGLALASARKETITAEDVALATTASADEAASIAARVFIDFSAPGHATLFLIDPRRGRIHVRRLMLDHGFDAVARESTLFVIEQSVDAILEGREIGVTREEYQRSVLAQAPEPIVSGPPPPVVPGPPAPAVPGPPTGEATPLLLAAGYEGVAMGSGVYQHTAKVVVAARRARFQVAAAARVGAPLSIAGNGVQARLWAGGVSLSGAARVLGLGRLSVIAGLGGGLDLTRVEPSVTTPDLQAAAVFWAASPSLEAFVGAEYRVGKLSLDLGVGAEAHPLAERYTVRTGTEARDIFVPSRLRPEAAVLVGTVF